MDGMLLLQYSMNWSVTRPSVNPIIQSQLRPIWWKIRPAVLSQALAKMWLSIIRGGWPARE